MRSLSFIRIWLVFIGLFGGTVPLVSAQPQQGNMTSVLEDFGRLAPEQKSMILNTAGMPDVSGFSVAKIVAWIIFGGVGFIAFVYGKKQQNFKPLLIGIALTGYPYFINDTFWLYGIGVGLCAALYFWRD